jgi:hypothetical protein
MSLKLIETTSSSSSSSSSLPFPPSPAPSPLRPLPPLSDPSPDEDDEAHRQPDRPAILGSLVVVAPALLLRRARNGVSLRTAAPATP